MTPLKGPMGYVHILRGPPMVSQNIEAEPKWCFVCRERTPHHWSVWCDLEPTYYDPEGDWVCEKCGGVHYRFPGF